MFPCPGLTENLTLLGKKEGEYIYSYHNQLDFASVYPHFHQFASAYTILVSSLLPHSHIFAGAYIVLVSSLYSFYHQVASALIIVTD